MARKWEAPEILAIAALPKALGDCIAGSTDGATTGGEYCGCHNGETTVADNGPAVGMCNASVPASYGHGCSSGGVPSTCFCGLSAAFPDF